MKGLLLFIISIVSTSIVFTASTTFSVVYYIFHFWKVKEIYYHIDKYFRDMALSVDQFANVTIKICLTK